MKADLHKSMYKDMLGQLIKKMRKGMVGSGEDKSPDMNMSEGDVLEDLVEGKEDEDEMSPEEISEYLKPKKKKEDREGVAIIAQIASSKKSRGVPFKKMSK